MGFARIWTRRSTHVPPVVWVASPDHHFVARRHCPPTLAWIMCRRLPLIWLPPRRTARGASFLLFVFCFRCCLFLGGGGGGNLPVEGPRKGPESMHGAFWPVWAAASPPSTSPCPAALLCAIGQKGEFGLLAPKPLDGDAREHALALLPPAAADGVVIPVSSVLERRLPPVTKHRLQSLDADPRRLRQRRPVPVEA